MRQKDEAKQEAIIAATVKLVNTTGFAAASVSKIAGEANVSPATLYIYYKNKEDLLVSTYTEIKHKISVAILNDFDQNEPIRDSLKRAWYNGLNYISRHLDEFQFAEQFSYSAYSSLVDKEKIDAFFAPLSEVLQKGIQQKIIKDVSQELLSVFIFYPVMILSNPKLCKSFQLSKENIETAFTLAWDAVKL